MLLGIIDRMHAVGACAFPATLFCEWAFFMEDTIWDTHLANVMDEHPRGEAGPIASW